VTEDISDLLETGAPINHLRGDSVPEQMCARCLTFDIGSLEKALDYVSDGRSCLERSKWSSMVQKDSAVRGCRATIPQKLLLVERTGIGPCEEASPDYVK
jgi:hypothetical protein